MAQDLESLTKFLGENRGKRKFKQSVELAINFKNIDLAKQDNRLNLEVLLPNGKGRVRKIGIFAGDKNMIAEAERNGIEIIRDTEIQSTAADSQRMTALLQYELVAQPNLMPVIAKSMGQFLGPRNKMPKPLLGNVNMEGIVSDLNRRIVIRSKGKNLPTVHCIVGNEDMEPEKIYGNIQEVLGAVNKRIGPNHIKSVYVKLTMSHPMRYI
ncbi:MAG: 50S ribosomal protein L1 [Candidatus Marsarchaeota archaeon]|jgi:large subunit ribosomal protein L1|nr:50S ribosomal protein L1 [Candidatus Marsarchaeota archaeon]